MTLQRSQEIEVHYFPDRIELCGETDSIHAEAQRILVCFRSSAHPYQIEEDGKNRIVLRELA
jgi:hypothetical protein